MTYECTGCLAGDQAGVLRLHVLGCDAVLAVLMAWHRYWQLMNGAVSKPPHDACAARHACQFALYTAAQSHACLEQQYVVADNAFAHSLFERCRQRLSLRPSLQQAWACALTLWHRIPWLQHGTLGECANYAVTWLHCCPCWVLLHCVRGLPQGIHTASDESPALGLCLSQWGRVAGRCHMHHITTLAVWLWYKTPVP